jgi:peroxidase
MAFVAALCLSSVLVFSISSGADALSLNYYEKTCPDVDSIVTNAVNHAMMKDKTVPAALLRMHFHDCFIRVEINISYFSSIIFLLVVCS